MPSRRNFLGGLAGAAIASDRLLRTLLERSNPKLPLDHIQKSIDRTSLVRRHNPVLTKVDPLSPLSLGNGTFAFTADVTGLQTLSREYENAMPLCTMSQWGWHSTLRPSNLVNASLRLTSYDTHGRNVGYHTSFEGQTELFNWLRENPHRLHLGQIGLYRIGEPDKDIAATDVSDIRQELDLWRGVLNSQFRLKGEPVSVTTTVHPDIDVVAIVVESKFIKDQSLGVRFRFPYGSSSMQAADWQRPDRHQTTITRPTPGRIDLRRTLDNDQYFISILLAGSTELSDSQQHTLIIKSAKGSDRIEFAVLFSHDRPANRVPEVRATFEASAKHWQRFWITGGAVDLSRSGDHRASELERRIVLSQYLTAIQCSGTIPPQETGLTVNSWYGKFHLEMHWWHATHFALWNRLPLFERSLGWYESILPKARELARSQGYEGARWPKMVGPEGRDSPSPIGPLLIWQQPHPIFYAELCYQSHPDRKTLRRYADLVFETATFMGSYAYFDQNDGRFVLGPPLIPAQENHPPAETWNPTFELAYWAFGLRVAQQWRERLGMKRLSKWDFLLRKLSLLPVREGVYLAHENCPQTYTERNRDHPSMLAALGFLPGDGVDRETMRRTLNKTLKEWKWDETWGWDYPLTAMTAARLGEGKIAVDALMMKTEKNRYLQNGHNYQRPNLPCYLPGNGGLLYAIAMMVAGWKNAPREHAPGFPNDGTWKVNWEGLNTQIAKAF
jgi:protein-glucosylgalactosylhydroxylysine glucosidase